MKSICYLIEQLMDSESIRKIRLVVSLLEKVANYKLEPQKALLQWPDIDEESDELIESSWHYLSHFENDSDIREKDPSYAAYQINQLLDKAKLLKSKYQLR